MKITKSISAKVIAANRRNAKKSTGPKTDLGKTNARHNALKHGLYAQEIYLSAEETADFEKLRRDLTLQLDPKSALQKLVLEEILFCAWRCKLAGRLEMQSLHSVSQEAHTAGSADEALMTGWYRANRPNLRAGIRFLSRLRDDVRTHGRVREFFKDELLSGFGTDFYDLLNVWLPVNVDVIGFTDQMLHHEENYKIPLPDKIPRVVVDVRAHLQMVVKLIDQQARHLEDLDQSFEQRTLSRERSTDFAPRYFSLAMRDLHSAVDRFAHLKLQRM